MKTPKLPKMLRSEADIIRTWKSDKSKPLVSVRCITYNHAPYIEDAIKGILIQETDFPFEVWIHDDASTDGTREIVEHYQLSYPKIIKTVLQEENQYSKGNKPGEILLKKCIGKYIAVCEGDDYWIDASKLQKQVEFLENHPDYVISGHDALVINSQGKLIKESKLPDNFKRNFSSQELSEGKSWILTLSIVYRNVVEEYAPERKMVVNGDDFFTSIIGGFGKSHYHKDIFPAAYRVHAGGVWSGTDAVTQQNNRTNTWFWMYRYYQRKKERSLEKIYYDRFLKSVIQRTSMRILLKELGSRIFLTKKVKKNIFIRKIIGNARLFLTRSQ